MKNIPINSVKVFLSDRTLLMLTGALLLAGIIYALFVSFSLEQSDLQVAIRYTAFGDTHFYRSKWYYLLSFVVFGLTVAVVHIGIAIKLFNRQLRQLSVAFLLLSLLLMAIGWIITLSILEIAFL